MNLKQIGADPPYPRRPRSIDTFFVAGANSHMRK
jgi:hypothetical protein